MKDRVYRELGKRIRVQRENRLLSVAQLAEAIGKSRSTIERYEQGALAMDVDVVYRIADVLRVGVGKLLSPPSEWEPERKTNAKSKVGKKQGDRDKRFVKEGRGSAYTPLLGEFAAISPEDQNQDAEDA